jgi:hypothetical protein
MMDLNFVRWRNCVSFCCWSSSFESATIVLPRDPDCEVAFLETDDTLHPVIQKITSTPMISEGIL